MEHDPDPPADRVLVDAGRRDLDPLDPDAAGVDLLQQIDAPQQRRLPGPARSDQADDLMVLDHEVDTAQHLELAEGLPDLVDANRLGHGVPRACRRRRSRAINQSVSRANGIVIRMNRNAATTKLE